jgi:hypothetical protein
VFATRGRKDDANRTYETGKDGRYRDLPLVVLIDERSASASEALAGSLQDHDRAVIVGRRSFGKALVQAPFFLPSGDVLWLTIGWVLSPSGRWIQRPYRGLRVELYRALAGHDRDERNVPTHRTDNGRPVTGGGGIVPDVELDTPRLAPAWWTAAAAEGFDVAVADSVALTLPLDSATREAWVGDTARWTGDLLPPFLDRVRTTLGVAADPDTAVALLVARAMARRVMEVRFGPEARREFQLRNDVAVQAARRVFDELPSILAAPDN